MDDKWKSKSLPIKFKNVSSKINSYNFNKYTYLINNKYNNNKTPLLNINIIVHWEVININLYNS